MVDRIPYPVFLRILCAQATICHPVSCIRCILSMRNVWHVWRVPAIRLKVLGVANSNVSMFS